MPERKISNNLVLELHVPDFEVVKDFYSKLGFGVVTDDPVGKDLGYLVLRRVDDMGETLINFYGGDKRVMGNNFFKDFPASTKRGYEVGITIPVANIDKFYETILPHMEGHMVQKLELNGWGKKDFRVADPFGFYLRFTELVDWGQ